MALVNTLTVNGKLWRLFDDWASVLAHVQATGHDVTTGRVKLTHATLYYLAPLDTRPSMVGVQARGERPSKLRVFPPTNDCDPFWADKGHVDRFMVPM